MIGAFPEGAKGRVKAQVHQRSALETVPGTESGILTNAPAGSNANGGQTGGASFGLGFPENPSQPAHGKFSPVRPLMWTAETNSGSNLRRNDQDVLKNIDAVARHTA